MTLDETQRQRFAAIADELIPPSDAMPSASDAGVAGRWLDAVLAARADLVGPLRDLLDQSVDRDPAELVAHLQANDPDTFAILAEIVPNAYFMNPDIRKAIGYTGQGGQPIDPRPDYMEDGLLESVIKRGPIYRPTP